MSLKYVVDYGGSKEIDQMAIHSLSGHIFDP